MQCRIWTENLTIMFLLFRKSKERSETLSEKIYCIERKASGKLPWKWGSILALYFTASVHFMPNRCVCQQAKRRALINTADFPGVISLVE